MAAPLNNMFPKKSIRIIIENFELVKLAYSNITFLFSDIVINIKIKLEFTVISKFNEVFKIL